ncbi:MAG: AAA family ATPase [Pseudonocardia sp.]|nr:AAA family ATPase [Pseudonocardia sp.]
MTTVPRPGVGIGLVGRRAERAALTAALARSRSGTACGVLLGGDAGVGKSRLAGELLDEARPATLVLVGRCIDAAESALPYLPFTEVVGSLLAARPELAENSPELLRLSPTGHPDARAREERELGQLRIFDAVLSGLEAAAERLPVLLLLEDLHWADRSTRDLLTFLLSRLDDQRLMVLATYRTDDLHRRHPLRPALSELVRLPAVERLELGPLPPADAVELVERLGGDLLGETDAFELARRSEGNAFFAEELVTAWDDSGSPGELSGALSDVLLARIERLPAQVQQVIRAASVAGRRVRHDRLGAICAQGTDGLDVDALEAALREAITRHVLVAESGPGYAEGYSFRHALLREAVYHDLLPGERSRLHGRYAALLSSAPDEPGAAAELARHALAAHDLPRALDASVRAAREADRQGAPAEVLVHAERAVGLWPAVPDPEQVTGTDEVQVTLAAAWSASATGDPDRGVALARRAVQLVDPEEDPHRAADVRVRLAMRLLDRNDYGDEPLAVAREAVALLAREPASADRAWAHAVLARACWRADEVDEMRAEAEEALQIARAAAALFRARSGDPEEPGPHDDPHDIAAAETDALITLAVSEEHAGRTEHSRALLSEALPLARGSGNVGVELRIFYNRGISFLDETRLAEAAAEFAAAEQRTAETGSTWSAYGMDLRVAHVITLFMAGEWDAAERTARLGGASVSATVAGRLAAAGLLVEIARGRDVEARWAELVAMDTHDDQVLLLIGRAGAESALWRGEPAEAARRIDRTLTRLRRVFTLDLAEIMLCGLGLAGRAELDRSAENLAAADALAAAAENVAANGMPRAGTLGPEGRAWLAQVRAELGRVHGRSDPQAWAVVVEAFAFDAHRQAIARLRRAEALVDAAVDTGRDRADGRAGATALREDATADLRAALEAAERLGAAPLATAVRGFAARSGLRLAPAAPASDGPFTPRERAVLALVAGGRTNRQVGEELFISEKTVSVHLSRVMAKLGAASRTEAVSLAHERGLLAAGPGADVP